MRPGSVEEVHVRLEHAVELLLVQDEQMIEALTPYTAEEPLTDGIRPRGVIRGCEHLDVTRLGNPREACPKLAIVIPNEVLRPHAIVLQPYLRKSDGGNRDRMKVCCTSVL